MPVFPARSHRAGVTALAALTLIAGQPTSRPAPRACFSATTADAGVVIWGGARACGVNVLSDSMLWTWNGTRWEAQSGPPIAVREDALLLEGPRPGTMTLIGGRRDGVVFQDVWTRENGRWRRSSESGGPGAIQHGAAAIDRARQRIVVFGGGVGTTMSGRTWEWDGLQWHQFDVAGPDARVGHGMAWSAVDSGVVLYGGFSPQGSYRDLWRWDGARWTRLSTDGPTHTEGALVSEAAHGIYVVGAGLSPAAGAPVRAWTWDGRTFRPASEPGPPLRIGASTLFDRARGAVVLFGGSDDQGTPTADTWELAGRTWRLVDR